MIKQVRKAGSLRKLIVPRTDQSLCRRFPSLLYLPALMQCIYYLQRRSVIFVVHRCPTQMLIKYIIRFKSTREHSEYCFLISQTNTQNENNEEPSNEVALLCTIEGECMFFLPLSIDQNISNVCWSIEISYDNMQHINQQIKRINQHDQTLMFIPIILLQLHSTVTQSQPLEYKGIGCPPQYCTATQHRSAPHSTTAPPTFVLATGL